MIDPYAEIDNRADAGEAEDGDARRLPTIRIRRPETRRKPSESRK